MEITHTMKYKSGGGTLYDGGDWNIKETDKSVVFTNIRQSFFEGHMPSKIRIPKSNKSKHCLSKCNEEDGVYVVYPFRLGVPHIFERVLK